MRHDFYQHVHHFVKIALTCATLLFPSLAQADANLNCEAYAQSAMAQIVEANSLGCGFGGPGWAADYNAHFNWCRSNGVGIMDVSREDQNRGAALDQCRQSQPQTLGLGDAECVVFANEMVGYARENIQRSCGLTGSRYDDNYQGHFNWCMSGVSKADVAANADFARSEIAQCTQKAAATFTCAFYEGRMITLTERYIAACNESLWPEDHKANCLAEGGSEQWMNMQEGTLLTKVEACEQNVVTYVPTNGDGTPLDGCYQGGEGCGQGVADDFCQHDHDHARARSFITGPTDFSVYLFCLNMPRGGASDFEDIGGKCFCRGSCGAFTSITCEGRR